MIPLPSAARSAAAVLAQAHSPTRAVLDRARPGRGWTIEYDEMQQIRPHPCVRIWGTGGPDQAHRAQEVGLHGRPDGVVVDLEGPPRRGPPALATTMSICPKRSTVAATSRSGTPDR